ncbi:hypothetical protein BDF14DRAFT_1879266 [Spinellus fusiger]|nr:hypothetical protein BDF14DRAFT_1879266 [Spinellus fusiger]
MASTLGSPYILERISTCGLIIGGCAGFMAEGISSLLLAATWGAESVKREVPEITVTASEKDIETQASIALGQTDPWDSHSTDHNMGSTEAVQERSTATKSNGMSSYWETSFFAEKHDEKGKGRESSLDNVETWRTSLTRQSSSSSVSSISSSHSYPLDNAQSSSAAVNTGDVRKRAAYVHDKYEWTEEEDEFPSRRNSQ